jgi:hypothetical protein
MKLREENKIKKKEKKRENVKKQQIDNLKMK